MCPPLDSENLISIPAADLSFYSTTAVGTLWSMSWVNTQWNKLAFTDTCTSFFLFSGAINIHPSLLPQWKGAAPMSHAILSGAKETGVSIVEVSRDRCVQQWE